ncbi:PhzF family phenazine biosynthesis protein [Streptomyces sp. NBC_01481]|uniref:PhzF family phenazine biosynthesis protein n=1 Tax=Streptomyces sp. NBC_01481 TaxID=2975869 RepID=UPI00225482BD|nr:PhzF family phenazine biosynthesis protein [Streptomyces sp. NBC_01481]MCX4585889.1 PhzF family phenazine biosynthesis protein [Streptomyces sp. NBC_01481]
MHPYVVVDVFARERLLGNPVAVFFDSDDLSPELMQRIAREMNLSETTFVLRPRQGGDARIRIFTPVNELPFAGHPLLGTALALARRIPGDRLQLETAVSVIPFELDRTDGRVTTARMQQPLPTWEPFDRTGELLDALGVPASTLPVEIYHNGPRHVFVGLDSVSALSALNPDHRALAAFEDMATNCFAGNGAHWRSRMFSPAYGVTEDAATGSAAGPLVVHLLRHGALTRGRCIEIMQGVEMGRPSRMLARAEGIGTHVESVEVGGDGVITAQGTLHV